MGERRHKKKKKKKKKQLNPNPKFSSEREKKDTKFELCKGVLSTDEHYIKYLSRFMKTSMMY